MIRNEKKKKERTSEREGNGLLACRLLPPFLGFLTRLTSAYSEAMKRKRDDPNVFPLRPLARANVEVGLCLFFLCVFQDTVYVCGMSRSSKDAV